MSTERPLDALLPELRAARTLPKSWLHPRILEAEVEEGFEWVLALWKDPGDPRRLHDAVRRLVEATLLAELSRPPKDVAREDRTFRSLRLMCFDGVAGRIAPAVKAFGLREVEYVPERYLARSAALTHEAQALGWDVPDHPVTVWEAPVAHPGGALGRRLREIQRQMATRMGGDVWGATPGGPSRLLARLVERDLGQSLAPDVTGLRRLEELLVRRETAVIRWIPGLLFQALCDFIGIVAQSDLGVPMAWAECAADPDGLAPPPVLRAERPDGAIHIPIGLHILRWCVMPVWPGERIPALAEWLVDQLGSHAERPGGGPRRDA